MLVAVAPPVLPPTTYTYWPITVAAANDTAVLSVFSPPAAKLAASRPASVTVVFSTAALAPATAAPVPVSPPNTYSWRCVSVTRTRAPAMPRRAGASVASSENCSLFRLPLALSTPMRRNTLDAPSAVLVTSSWHVCACGTEPRLNVITSGSVPPAPAAVAAATTTSMPPSGATQRSCALACAPVGRNEPNAVTVAVVPVSMNAGTAVLSTSGSWSSTVSACSRKPTLHVAPLASAHGLSTTIVYTPGVRPRTTPFSSPSLMNLAAPSSVASASLLPNGVTYTVGVSTNGVVPPLRSMRTPDVRASGTCVGDVSAASVMSLLSTTVSTSVVNAAQPMRVRTATLYLPARRPAGHVSVMRLKLTPSSCTSLALYT
mmetsp:Transcript_14170/g.35091  ORF Transcript_14170/g.35091 Transcript_14170/m.35091 type:complete len:374 (-) Transcript_14170:592-1713(-)